MAFLTSQSWPILESWHTGWGGKGFWYCFDDELNQAQVVQTLDSAIHRINHYPAAKYYRTNCAIQWIVFCPVDSVIHLLNSWSQKFSSVCGVGYSWMWGSDTAKFAQKNPAKSAVFYWLFLGEVFARNFRWNWPIFLRISPWKSFKIWLFSAKIPRNRPIFPRICPWKSHEILFSFFLRNIRSPAY